MKRDEEARRLRTIFSSNLNRLMMLHDKKIADLSTDLEVAYATVSDWVHGRKYPRMDKVQALADYFGVLKSELTEDQPSESDMEFSRRMKECRQRLDLTISDIASYLDVSEAIVKRYEGGDNKNMKRTTIAKLAKILEVTPAYLMGWSDSPDGALTPKTVNTSVELLSALLGVSEQDLLSMDEEEIDTKLAKELAGIKNVSAVDAESGEYIKQLPEEAIKELNNHIKLLAQAYLKDKRE